MILSGEEYVYCDDVKTLEYYSVLNRPYDDLPQKNTARVLLFTKPKLTMPKDITVEIITHSIITLFE